MNIKRLAALAVICCGLALGASAQAGDTVPIITIENGFSSCYNLGTSNLGSAFEIALDFGVSDKLQAQTIFIQGDAVNFNVYRLLGLSYAVLPKVGISALMGRDTTAAANVAGLGLYSNLLTRSVAGSLQTGLKLKVDYIAPVNSFSTGIFRFGLSATLGM